MRVQKTKACPVFSVNVFGVPVLAVFACVTSMCYFCCFVRLPTCVVAAQPGRVRVLGVLCPLLCPCCASLAPSTVSPRVGSVNAASVAVGASVGLCSVRAAPRSTAPPPPPACSLLWQPPLGACETPALLRAAAFFRNRLLFSRYRPFKPPRRSPPSAGRGAGCLAPAARGARGRRRACPAPPSPGGGSGRGRRAN